MASKPQFTKIVANARQIALDWRSTKKTADEIEEVTNHELRCPAKPLPSFDKALQAFKPFLMKIIGAPASWTEGTTVTGISINKEEDGRRGVVISATRKCPHGLAPISISTPHLREALDEAKETAANFFLDGMAEAIDEMIVEAQRYLDGGRSQGELFGGDDKKAGRERAKSSEPELIGSVLNRAPARAH